MAGPRTKPAPKPKFVSKIGTAVAVKRMPNGKIVQVDPRSNMAPRGRGSRKVGGKYAL